MVTHRIPTIHKAVLFFLENCPEHILSIGVIKAELNILVGNIKYHVLVTKEIIFGIIFKNIALLTKVHNSLFGHLSYTTLKQNYILQYGICAGTKDNNSSNTLAIKHLFFMCVQDSRKYEPVNNLRYKHRK